MIDEMNYRYYPADKRMPPLAKSVVRLFHRFSEEIRHLRSNDVLEAVRSELEQLQFRVEKGKRPDEKIEIPTHIGLRRRRKKDICRRCLSQEIAVCARN